MAAAAGELAGGGGGRRTGRGRRRGEDRAAGKRRGAAEQIWAVVAGCGLPRAAAAGGEVGLWAGQVARSDWHRRFHLAGNGRVWRGAVEEELG